MKALVRKGQNKILHLQSIRDNFLVGFEKANMYLNILLCIMGYIMCFTGMLFCAHELLGYSKDPQPLPEIKQAALIFIVAYLFITPVLGCTGIMIARRRTCSNGFIAIWGVLIFSVLVVPLLSEGALYLAIDSITKEDLDVLCTKDKATVQKEHGRIERALHNTALAFDTWTEQLIDQYMCHEDVCPCLNYEATDVEGKETDTRTLYKQGQNPEVVAERNRTFFSLNEDKSKTLMYFNGKGGFKSMKQCMEYYQNLENGEIAKKYWYIPEKPPKVYNIQKNTFVKSLVKDFSQYFAMSLELEDHFNCSGMCKPSLFYYSKNLDQGPPQETCLIHMKNLLQYTSRSFAIASVLTSLVGMFVFVLHFFLYGRPSNSQEQKIDLSNRPFADQNAHNQVPQDTERADQAQNGDREDVVIHTDNVEIELKQ